MFCPCHCPVCFNLCWMVALLVPSCLLSLISGFYLLSIHNGTSKSNRRVLICSLDYRILSSDGVICHRSISGGDADFLSHQTSKAHKIKAEESTKKKPTAITNFFKPEPSTARIVQVDGATMYDSDCANSDCDDPKRPGELIQCAGLGCRTKVCSRFVIFCSVP